MKSLRKTAWLLAALAMLLPGCAAPAADGDGVTEEPAVTFAPTPAPTPSRPGVSIALTDPAGEAVAGARVCLTDPVSLFIWTALTDKNGEARFEEIPAGAVFLSVRADGYADAGRVLNLGGGPVEETVALEPLPVYGTRLMALCVRYADNTCRIYLFQSDDGVAWEAAAGEAVAEGELTARSKNTQVYEALVVTMSPDVIYVDGSPRVYFDDQFAYVDAVSGEWARKTVNQDPGDWNPEHELVFINEFGFFDFQVCALRDNGRLYLLGKNKAGYGYRELDIVMGVGGSVGDSVFGYAAEAEGGVGQIFVCEENRYLLTLPGNHEIREPYWFAAEEGYGMIATDGGGLRLYRADELTGAWALSDALEDGLLYAAGSLAGACVDYDPGAGLYSVYVSFLDDTRILMARTDTLEEPLTGADFQVVLDGSSLPGEQGEIVFVGNPGVCRSQADEGAAAGPSGPFSLSLEEPTRYTMMAGMGSASSGASFESQALKLRMTCGETNPSHMAALLTQGYFSGFAVSADVALPADEEAMGGLAYCWQDAGRYMGGYCFRVSSDQWELIHVKGTAYLDGSFLSPISEEQISVVAEGTWDEPFTEGRLTAVYWGGVHYFFRDGEYAGRAAMEPHAVTDLIFAQQHMTGYPGLYIKATVGETKEYTFRDFVIADLTGTYAGP